MRARLAALAALFAVAACGGGERKDINTGSNSAAEPGAGETRAGGPSAVTPQQAGAQGAAAGAATGPAAGSTGTLADASTVAQVESVYTAVRNDVSTFPVPAAVGLIRSLEGKLNASDDGDLKDIGAHLGQLREELGQTPVNGREVGEHLSELAPRVAKVAAKGGPAGAQLNTIADGLTRAGRALQGKQGGGQ
jgi:hypothetical protein